MFTHTHVTLRLRKGAGICCPSRSQACVITFNDEELAKRFKEATDGLQVWNCTGWCRLSCSFVHYVMQRDTWWRGTSPMQIRPPCSLGGGSSERDLLSLVQRRRRKRERERERERGGRPGPSLPGGLAGGPGRAGEGRGIALRNVLPPAPQVVWLLLSHTPTFKRRNEFAERFKCRVRKTLEFKCRARKCA